jgi:hypothetical protein
MPGEGSKHPAQARGGLWRLGLAAADQSGVRLHVFNNSTAYEAWQAHLLASDDEKITVIGMGGGGLMIYRAQLPLRTHARRYCASRPTTRSSLSAPNPRPTSVIKIAVVDCRRSRTG